MPPALCRAVGRRADGVTRFLRNGFWAAMPVAKITGNPCSIRAALLTGAAGFLVIAVPATAQQRTAGAISQEVVQPLPARESLSLNAALARLGQNPRDVDALIDAGKAALAMGDTDAAVGFFGRADQISPGNPRVKAGLAGALVRDENPFDAIPLFEEAERGGGLDGTFAADRALAYDLVGDNVTAQRYYREALARGPNDEATRRLALSLAMSGDKQGAERTLAPLLSRRDKPAFRTRAFVFAIVGEVENAVGIAYASLPQDMAASISPYLRYMPRLTKAQQAAAANFGHFPRASEIGRDDPRVARYAATAPGLADAAVAPKRETLGSNSRRGKNRKSRAAQPVRTLPPEPQVSREIVMPATAGKPATRTVVAAAAPSSPPATASTPTPAPAPRPAFVTPTAPPTPQVVLPKPSPQVVLPAQPPTAALPSPAPVMGPVLSQLEPGAGPAPSSKPSLAPAQPRSVADAFGDLSAPAPSAAPTPGAVDIRKITPSRPKPKAEAAKAVKPQPPSHPSRIWVQVATGRNKDALGFDWRRMTREAPDAFRGKKANVSDWGQNNRLLAGPFPTEAAAQSFITQLRRANIDGPFVWTSPAGQVVDALPVR
jgi:Flp pilus assembly protein TadD